jgi:hypothetical protein
LLFYILFLFIGLGLTILFSPKEWLKYTVFLSPLIGYCLLTLTGWVFYSLNFKGTDDYYYWILLIALLLLIGAIIKIWKQRILTKLFSRELIIPLLIAIIVFLAIAFPSLRQPELTTMSLGNNDIASYALFSKIVKEIPKIDIPNTIDYAPFQEQTLGGFINTAFFCSVAKLDPYQVQMISLYVFFIISLLLTYILGREVFRYTSFASNVIILLYGLSSLLYYVIYNGFENQIIAVPLMLFIMLSNVAVVMANKFRDALRYVPFLFLALWGLSLTYSHMFVIIYGLIIAYVLLSCWKNRKVTKLLNWAAINCIAALIIVCLSPQRLQMVISNTFTMSSVSAGWFMPWITPQKLYGITSFLIPDTNVSLQLNQLSNLQNYIGITIIISIFLIVVIVSGFVKLFRQDKEKFLFSLSTFALIFLGAIMLSLLNIVRTNEGFGGYNQFKLISFFLPLLLLSSFAVFGDITFNIRSRLLHAIKSNHEYVTIKKNTVLFLIIAALVIANCLSAGISLYGIFKSAIAIPPDAVDLQIIRDNKEIKSINIPADSGAYWNIMWEAYFLFPKKLFFEQSTYYAATPLNGGWSLIRNVGKNTEKILSISPQNDSNTIPINSAYSLKNNTIGLSARFGKGWSDNQIDHRWTISDVASIIIDSASEKVRTNLTLKYWPLKKDNSLSIYLNGVKIMDCDNDNFCVIKELLLRKGENIIEFRAKLPAELPGNGDPRKLCYCFQSIAFEEIE